MSMNETDVQVANLWLLESIAYQLSHNFISLCSNSGDSCSPCMYRWISIWDHLINLLPEAVVDCRLFNWAVVSKLVTCSYSSSDFSTLETMTGQIEEQRVKLRIEDGTSSSVLQFLHTMITIYYFNEQNIRKARKHMQKHSVLYEEKVVILLNSGISATIPDELELKNLQKHILPYIRSVLNKLGRPRIFDIISWSTNNMQSEEENARRARLDMIVFNHMNTNNVQSSDTEEAANSGMLPLCDVAVEINCNEVSSSGDLTTVNCEPSPIKSTTPSASPVFHHAQIDTDNEYQGNISLSSEATPKQTCNKSNSNTNSTNRRTDTDIEKHGTNTRMSNADVSQIESGCQGSTIRKRLSLESEFDGNSIPLKNKVSPKQVHGNSDNITARRKTRNQNKLQDFKIHIAPLDVNPSEEKSTFVDFTNVESASNTGDSFVEEISDRDDSVNETQESVASEKITRKITNKSAINTDASPVNKRKRSTQKKLTAPQTSGTHNVDSGESVAWTSDEEDTTMPCQLDSYTSNATQKETQSSRHNDRIHNVNRRREQQPKQHKLGNRVKFTAEEERYVIDGVNRFGTGNWKQILVTYAFHESRTNISIKDKYRTLVKQGVIVEK